MKRFNYRLFFIGVVAAMCMVTIQSCDKLKEASEEACGPCGTIATGDFSVSGNARLDGFFQAVGTLQTAVASIKGKFDADVLALADVYGLPKGEVDAEFVNALVAEIEADIDANVQGGLQVNYQPPKCQASVDVAISAQAKCEAKAGCDVKVDPGKMSVECKGSCSGGCTGKCTGDLSCKVQAPSVACEGQCEGSCELSAAATCEGACHGDCSGSCEVKDGSGKCAGKCDGQCSGTCELSAKAECKGTCHGSCYVEQGSASCTGEVECSGSCDAKCEGSCEGEFVPPSASADCDASVDCQAQASANASASLECTPPSLEVGYKFKAGVDASAQAAFFARIGELKVRGAAIVQGYARLSALIDGKVDNEIVFKTSPVAQLKASIEGLLDADAYADLDIPAGRLGCLADAFEVAGTTMASIGTEAKTMLEGQAKIAAVVTGK